MEKEQYTQQVQPPENYMVWSILCTVCCCFPVGIFAILKSIEVNKLWKEGDVKGAKEASEKAFKIIILSIMVGVTIAIVLFSFTQSFHVLDYLRGGY